MARIQYDAAGRGIESVKREEYVIESDRFLTAYHENESLGRYSIVQIPLDRIVRIDA